MALRADDGVLSSSLPRLADWGEWAAAVYEVQGWEASQFARDWDLNVDVQNTAVIEGSTLAQVVTTFVEEESEWEGRPSDLLNSLSDHASDMGLKTDKDGTFPKAPNVLSRRLRELQPVLTAQGVVVEIWREGDKEGTRRIRLAVGGSDDAAPL